MSIFLTILWSAVELISYHFICSAFFPKKVFGKRYILHYLLAWVLVCLYLTTGIHAAIKTCISIVFLTTLFSMTYHAQFLRNILLVIAITFFAGLNDTLFIYGGSALLQISVEDFIWRKASYSIAVTIGKLLFLFACWIIRRFRKGGKPEPVQTKWLFLSILFPTITLVMLMFIYFGYRNQGDISAWTIGLFALMVAANVGTLYLIRHLEKSAAEAKNQALLSQQMEIQSDSIHALERSYREQRKTIHEHRSQLQTIHDLVSSGHYASAEEYIQQLQGVHTTRIFPVNSHHPIIDAVLNHKYQKATEQGIDFQVKVNDLSGLALEADSLVVVLSNLLENAIEACLRLDGDRQIHCRILAEDSLFISIRNTSVPVQIIDHSIATTKQNKENHGYGLQQIGYILQQQKAEYSISYENGWFQFVAEIPVV